MSIEVANTENGGRKKTIRNEEEYALGQPHTTTTVTPEERHSQTPDRRSVLPLPQEQEHQ
jgi:hypothetical protein